MNLVHRLYDLSVGTEGNLHCRRLKRIFILSLALLFLPPIQ